MSRPHVLFLALLFATGATDAAQDAPSAAAPAAAQPGPAAKTPPAAQPAGSKQRGTKAAEAKPPLRQEHVIYVPFKNLRSVMDREDASIVLPYAQFLEMWERLAQARPAADQAAGGRADHRAPTMPARSRASWRIWTRRWTSSRSTANGPACRCSSATRPSDRRGARTNRCCCEASARGGTNCSSAGKASTRSSCTW